MLQRFNIGKQLSCRLTFIFVRIITIRRSILCQVLNYLGLLNAVRNFSWSYLWSPFFFFAFRFLRPPISFCEIIVIKEMLETTINEGKLIRCFPLYMRQATRINLFAYLVFSSSIDSERVPCRNLEVSKFLSTKLET